MVVFGAGVFGITAALELHARGWRVEVREQGPIPHPLATSNDSNRVIRADYGSDDFFVDLGLEALERWRIWNAAWAEPPYREDGFLLLSAGGLEPGTFEGDSFLRLEARGVPVERLSTLDVRRRFPAWRTDGFAEAYFNPRAGWAPADRVLRNLVETASERGIELRPHQPVAPLAGAELDDLAPGADAAVVAAGPWTPALLADVDQLMWPSGQPILYLRPTDPTSFRPPAFTPWAADLSHSGWYGISALPDGTVKVAHHGRGTRVDPGDPPPVTDMEISAFRRFLTGALPDLASGTVARSRRCVYCDTWDGDFWIAAHPDQSGVFVATGGSGHGFKFAPVLGEITADVVEGIESERTRRFAWRARGSLKTEDARASVDLA